ncbi:MAG: hypothetical protein ACI3ZL_06580 [Candidatus Cryptobacteroides sp.]
MYNFIEMAKINTNLNYSCSEDGHGLKYPGFSVVFIQTFALHGDLKFTLPHNAVLAPKEYADIVARIDAEADRTKYYASLADASSRPIAMMKRNIEKQIFVTCASSTDGLLDRSPDNPFLDIDPRLVYRFSLRGFDFTMPIEPDEDEDFYPVLLKGHVYVEMSVFFGNTISLTYRFCFNGHAATLSEPVMTDHIIALLSTFLGAEYWSNAKTGVSASATDRLAAQSDINLETEFHVSGLWYGDDGEVLDSPRNDVDLSGKGRTFDIICQIYKSLIYRICTSFADGITNRRKLEFATWRSEHPINVRGDYHYAMVDIWENVMHPVNTTDGKTSDWFKKKPGGLTEAQIIRHIRDFHKPELIGLMTLYPGEWPYRDEEAYDDVCGGNIAIDTDDLVLAGTNMAVVIGTYGRRGDEVKAGDAGDAKVKKQGVNWAKHLRERAKYHVSWPEYLMILQMVLAKKYIIGVAKDQLVDVALTAKHKSSDELIGQNAELGIRLSRLILQLDVVKYSKFASHVVMFDRTTQRLSLEHDMEQLKEIVDMVDNSLHNLSDYKAMKSDFLLNVILAIISCASTFELFFQTSEMPFLTYFNIRSNSLSAWLVAIVAAVTIFAILLVTKNFIQKIYEKIRNRNFRKEYAVIRNYFSRS